ncbi:hypothetical protein M5X06_29950, partial [Paenibacillus alvei]
LLAAQQAEEEAARERAAAEEAKRQQKEQEALLAAQQAEEEAARERAATEEAKRRQEEAERAEYVAQKATLQELKKAAAELAEATASGKFEKVEEEAEASVNPVSKVTLLRGKSELNEIHGTKVIAVGGFGRRTGSTYTSLQVAQFLSGKNMKVACVELAPTPQTAVFRYFVEQGKPVGGGYHLRGVTYYANWPLSRIHELYTGQFSFVVLDCGALADISDVGEIMERSNLSEFFRADISIITTFSSLWDSLNFAQLAFYLEAKRWSKPMHVLAQSKLEDCSEIMNLIPSSVRRNMAMSFYAYSPGQDAFTPEGQIQEAISKVFSVYFPQKRSSKFSFFRKG